MKPFVGPAVTVCEFLVAWQATSKSFAFSVARGAVSGEIDEPEAFEPAPSTELSTPENSHTRATASVELA
jgi:hypothetical protein